MRLILISAILMSFLTGCSKSEFNFPMDENLYESRYPLEIDRLYGFMDAVGMANQHHIFVSWRMDKKYLEDFYPGYEVSMYRKTSGGENFITTLASANGSKSERANAGTYIFRATQGSVVIFEFEKGLDW
ncbi:MAG: hypothetical protein AB8B53_11415 [Flavobacteriales bacterium]